MVLNKTLQRVRFSNKRPSKRQILSWNVYKVSDFEKIFVPQKHFSHHFFSIKSTRFAYWSFFQKGRVKIESFRAIEIVKKNFQSCHNFKSKVYKMLDFQLKTL